MTARNALPEIQLSKTLLLPKFLLLLVSITATVCRNTSDASSYDARPVVENSATEGNCRFDLKEKLKAYLSPVPNDYTDVERDRKILGELAACPREETVAALENLRAAHRDDLEIKSKTAYFLVKLGHLKSENAKILPAAYSTWWKSRAARYKDPNYKENVQNKKYDDSFDGERILSLINDLVATDYDDAEFIGSVLELETDGAYATMLAGFCVNQFVKNPENFLRIVKTRSKAVQDDVLLFLTMESLPGELEKGIAAIPKSSDVYSLGQKLTEMIEKRKQTFPVINKQ